MPGCLFPSTCPRITAGPISPGVGALLYQPACMGWLTGGTSMVWSGLSPRETKVDLAPIFGMEMSVGGEAGSAAVFLSGGAACVELPDAAGLAPELVGM